MRGVAVMGVEFPLVVCDRHPHATPRPGWIVCAHVLDDGITIAHMVTPTSTDLGEIFCHDCHVRYRLDHLRLCCPDCVADLLDGRELKP